MQETLLAYLKEQGATIQAIGAIDFDSPEIRLNNITETPLASPLSGFAVLEISGNDRSSFLHGQFINDLNKINNSGAQYSAWCNPKGQVISTFLVINTGSTYRLIFKEDLKELIQQRLGMYILRSDVKMNDISGESPLLGIANINNLEILNTDIPAKYGSTRIMSDLLIVCLPDFSDRYLITGKIEKLINKVTDLKETLSLTSSTIWDLLDNLSGVPWISAATKEQFLPQMLNLDLLKGLSYQKGCYPGQEIIARLHYKGKVKKRLNLIQSASSLHVGDHLYSEQSDKSVGTIINSATHPDGKSYSLAVIEIDYTNYKLFSDVQTNDEITIIELNYDINS